MFGNRRKRGSSNPPLNGSNANPSAATAAAQAFLQNQASNASLSSAAAATALRSRPTTPTSVAEVQTKRTLRRSGSTSSMGSSIAGSVSGGSRPTLQRKGSTGSMTERTFRDQPPSQAVPSAPDAPPVPAIPKNIPAIPPKSHRRAASLENPPMRVASPPPNKANGRGSSLGPGTTAQPPRRGGQRITSLSSVQELTGVERPDSRGSVNFSYPTGSRPTSPIAQRRLTSPSPSRANSPRITSSNQNMIYDPNSRRFIPAHEYYAIEYAIEQRIQDAANRPVKKKKKVAPQQFTGTHLADGTIGGRPKGTAVDAMEARASQPNPVEQPPPAPPPAPITAPASTLEPIATTPKKKRKKRVVVTSDSDSDQASFMPNSSADESDIQTNGFNTREGALLAKKPSIVREDREREEEEDDTPQVRDGLGKLDALARSISPSSLPHSTAGRGHGRGEALASAAFAQERQHSPAPISPVSTPATDGLTAKGSVRVQSVSPVRTTHFATTPDSLVVKHQPPPRSISPRKSALKRSNSPRGPSPADDASNTGHVQDSSEMSNGSTATSDELSLPRKKAVRVSFDETNVVVGQAAAPVTTDSPVAQSPQQAKKSWFSSIGRGKKKDMSVVEDNDDEVMKPRPALPSFGSVRGKKDNREPVEERPLVKPAESVDSTPPALPSPPLFANSAGEAIEFPLGLSNDHKVGAILSQDASSKNAANISKSREPLPPQVLSVEGSGYSSDTDSSVSDQKSPVAVAHDTNPVEEVRPVEIEIDPSAIDRDSQTSTPTEFKSGGDVPEIAVLQATPTLEHSDVREWPDMPGGWNGSSASDSGSTNDETSTVVEHTHTCPTTPATIGIAEPTPAEVQPHSPVLGDVAAEDTHTIPAIMEETEESDTSVYSDAAEDLSDGDGDGFQSLDAVVDSPIVASAVPGLAVTTPPESPTVIIAKERAYKSQLSKKSSEPDLDEGWGKAQEYWKGLSAEKKRQLEQEARDEADATEESDSTIEVKPAPKPKKKKKVAVLPATAEVPILRQPTPNERSYMIQPGSKAEPDGHTSIMRSSMHAGLPSTTQDPHIRKSMRGPGAMRGSMRNEETRGSLSKKNRPVSLPAPKADQAAVNMHVRNLSAASAAAASGAAQRDMAAKPPPALRRKSSGDSDSSFKRARKSTEGSSMRRSMRTSANEHQQSPVRPSRFSLRSLSPTGSAYRKPFNSAVAPSASQTHMRQSLRGSVGATPSMRGPKPEKSSRIPGFGRSSSTKPTPKPIRQRSSRFADSSDEEDMRPAFRSRFADSDSDDDDMPTPQSGGFGAGTMRTNAPIRGIPKRRGVEDGDSSDLPDSDDEKKSPKLPLSPGLKLSKNRQNGSAATSGAQGMSLASGSLRRSGSGRETMGSPTTAITATATPRPPNNRRGSFMNILKRKKPDPNSKVRKSDAESPARRDTPLERSKFDLQAVKRQESYASTTADRPSTPKLQKKAPGWPLVSDSPHKIIGDEDGRPYTAGAGDGVVSGEAGKVENRIGEVNGVNGVNGDGRPDIGTSRFTATGLGGVDLNGVGKGRKKKKFGALRRMFRLDD